MKAVMYHYVRGQTARPPDYYHLDADDFRRQLAYFEEEFGFVDREAFLAAVRGEVDSPPEGVVLTFDDGLRDHYDVVFPELERRGLWGIFYVPVAPYVTDRLLDVHRTHTLLGEVSGPTLLEHTREIIDESMIPHRRRAEFRNESYHRHDDTEATKQAKRILNYFVADEYQTEVLDRLVEKTGYDLPTVEQYYVRPAELREMHEGGMIVGGHTVTHPVLSKLDEDDQRTEITDAFAYLEDVIGDLSARTFCYPYGHEHTYDDRTQSILEAAGCEWCFKVESADITAEDLQTRRQALPRYDCNEFPHGEASGSIGSAD